MNITQELDLTHHRFRGRTRPNSVLDYAAYINQNDRSEKGAQVSMMGDIHA